MTLVDLHNHFSVNGIEHWGGDSKGTFTVYYDPNDIDKRFTIPKEEVVKKEIVQMACNTFNIELPKFPN